MSASPDERVLILSNKARLDAIEAATISFTEFSSVQKRLLIENVFPNGVQIDINDPNLKVGDPVAGEKAGINGGKWVMGYVLIAPPTTDAHIRFKYQEL